MWLDRIFRWPGHGSVLLVGVGTKGVLDWVRLLFCLAGGRREVLRLVGLNFNDE